MDYIGKKFTDLTTGSVVEVKDQFEDAEEYKKFLFQYLKERQLPDDVQKFLDDLEK